MNKEENKYHNWLGVWHGLVLLLMSMAGLLGYRHFAYLPWTEVLVHANYQQITQAELQQMIVACLQHGMLSDSLTAIKQQLVRNPWIKELEIKRAWPGILQLKIVERRLVAIWQDHTLIDDQQQLIALELAKQP